MRATRYLVAGTICALGAASAVVVATRGRVWANRCPATGNGYTLIGQNSNWEWFGFSSSSHIPNDHSINPHDGKTQFDAMAHKEAGHKIFKFQGGWDDPKEIEMWGNNESFNVTLATPFFNGQKALKASPSSLGTQGGVQFFEVSASLTQPWTVGLLKNSNGKFTIECGGGSHPRNDPYHDVGTGAATTGLLCNGPYLCGYAAIQGPIGGCAARFLEDVRGGLIKYELDEGGHILVDEDGFPELDLDEYGQTQWHSLPQVTTRLTSSVKSNGNGTITYLYMIENLTSNAIPFSVAQVPVSPPSTGWSGTVSGNSSVATSLTVGCGDDDLHVENACMELKVDGSSEFNEATAGQIYVPGGRREFTGTCAITSITRSGVPSRNHVTILLSGGSAQDIYLFRETETGGVCVGEMHGAYFADDMYTIDSVDAPPGPVTYYVSVGKGVNKHNSEASTTENL